MRIMLQQALFWLVCCVKQSVESYNVQLKRFSGFFFPPLGQVTPVLCRKTSSTRDACLSPTTGSASTPKCLAKTPRYWWYWWYWCCCPWSMVQTTCVSASHLTMLFLGQIAIPVMSVAHIKKTKTAILVPNALVIATASDKVRRSDRREATAQKLRWLR